MSRYVWSEEAWADYLHWQGQNRRLAKRVNELLKSIARDGQSTGIGKPEPLRHGLSGYWSRRIDQEHRLVYRCEGEDILIAAARYHYED